MGKLTPLPFEKMFKKLTMNITRSFAVWDAVRNLPEVEGRKNQTYAMWDFEETGRFYSTYPSFHLAGFVNNLVLPLWYDCAVVLGPPSRPATGDMVCQIMRHFPLRAIMCAPTVLEEVIQEHDGLELCKGLDFLIFTGGPLAPSAGDALAKVTQVCQLYGSSETGVIAALVPKEEDWRYFEFHPAYGERWELVGENEYEMVIERDMSRSWYRGICHTFPELELYRTKDVSLFSHWQVHYTYLMILYYQVFTPHPTKPGLWSFKGRIDDIMVLGNGEKFNPSPMEAIVQGHPAISGALMVGVGRFQPALLVEPTKAIVDQEKFLDSIWGIVKQANASGPAHAKIVRSLTAIVGSESFIRAGKGTVIRNQTSAKFASRVERLYTESSSVASGSVPILARPFQKNSIQPFVQSMMLTLFPGVDIRVDDDLFNLGIDSLQTIELVNSLRAGLKLYRPDIDLSWLAIKLIYSNPSVSALSDVMGTRLSDSQSDLNSHSDEEELRIAGIRSMVDKYTHDLPDLLPVVPRQKSKLHVVLTGSTGSLGTNLLKALIHDTQVRAVTCLNRSANAFVRHTQNLTECGLQHNYDLSPSGKVRFFQVDFGHPSLRIDQARYDGLVSDVDVIIHNAWKVDFNHTLKSFEETHIKGVRNFIDWSIQSPRHPSIVYVSSISSVGNSAPGSTVSEYPHTSYSVAQKLGYGESKHVAERILAVAQDKSSVPSSILRVGQIAGPLARNGGVWNETEWFPSLVKSALSMGAVPGNLTPVDWIPVDVLACVILEVIHSRVDSIDSESFNLVNPTIAEWAPLMKPIKNLLRQGGIVVSLKEWVEILRTYDVNNSLETERKPALKILGFFEEIAQTNPESALNYRTDNGRRASRTMANLSAVKPEWMVGWLAQWAEVRSRPSLFAQL